MNAYDFSLETCKKSVLYYMDELHANPFTELGRAVTRAKQDPLFNKVMIEAWEWYIEEYGWKWND